MKPLELRTALSLSQSKMARLMGVTPVVWRSWERGRRKPAGSAVRLMHVLNMLHIAAPALIDVLIIGDNDNDK